MHQRSLEQALDTYVQLCVCCCEDPSLWSIWFKGIPPLSKPWMFTRFFVSRWWWDTGKGSKGATLFKLQRITSSSLSEVEAEPLKVSDRENETWLKTQEVISKVRLALKLFYLQYRSSTLKLQPFILSSCMASAQRVFLPIPFYLPNREIPWVS